MYNGDKPRPGARQRPAASFPSWTVFPFLRRQVECVRSDGPNAWLWCNICTCIGYLLCSGLGHTSSIHEGSGQSQFSKTSRKQSCFSDDLWPMQHGLQSVVSLKVIAFCFQSWPACCHFIKINATWRNSRCVGSWCDRRLFPHQTLRCRDVVEYKACFSRLTLTCMISVQRVSKHFRKWARVSSRLARQTSDNFNPKCFFPIRLIMLKSVVKS